MAVSSVKHQWLSDVVAGYQSVPSELELLTCLATHSSLARPFYLQHGVIRHNGRVWLGSNTSVQQLVLQAFHSEPVGGHLGVPATYQRIKHLFFWPGMKKDI
jgi:hypothetical protein